MSEGQREPPDHLRSFLPRPGEPVAQYAERLRGLHRDLTLVLQAVERGVPVPGASPLAPDRPPATPPALRAAPRVEVVPSPPGPGRRDAGAREPARPAPPAPVERWASPSAHPPPAAPRVPSMLPAAALAGWLVAAALVLSLLVD